MEEEKAKRYFIRRHDRISGPFTKEELRARSIEAETHGWNETAFDWQEAQTFAELKEVLHQPSSALRHGLMHWLRSGRRQRH